LVNSPLTLALAVSGIGLLALFAALAFLYGLMYAMTALIKDRPSAKQEESALAVETDESAAPAARRAAVIAVALARAELESSPASPLPAEAGSSSWGQYHRRRLLDLNLRTRTGR
jgi:Na+-transporting methylmalonyl-CoA/oxaloacetate decarboxylase gamma subunit